MSKVPLNLLLKYSGQLITWQKTVNLLPILKSLQPANSLDMERVLSSKTVAVEIIEHVSSQMKKKLLNKIVETESKINVLANESTRVGGNQL